MGFQWEALCHVSLMPEHFNPNLSLMLADLRSLVSCAFCPQTLGPMSKSHFLSLSEMDKMNANLFTASTR